MGHHYASKQRRTCQCCKGAMELRIDKDNSFRDVLEHLHTWKMFFTVDVKIQYLRFLKINKWNKCPVCDGLGHEEIIQDEWIN